MALRPIVGCRAEAGVVAQSDTIRAGPKYLRRNHPSEWESANQGREEQFYVADSALAMAALTCARKAVS